jgi:molybdopterin-guanine dinucleotide biosynthesis protein A
MNTSLAILAGGKATRLNGLKKHNILINNKRIIDIQIYKLSNLFNEIFIVSNYYIDNLNLPVIPDIYSDIGPLGGIHSALKYSKNDYVFVISVDLPFVNVNFMKEMLKSISNQDSIIPLHSKNHIEPLHAIYNKRIVKIIEEQIKNNKYSVNSLLNRINTFYLNVSDLYKPEIIFLNINNFDDIKKANDYAKFIEH